MLVFNQGILWVRVCKCLSLIRTYYGVIRLSGVNMLHANSTLCLDRLLRMVVLNVIIFFFYSGIGGIIASVLTSSVLDRGFKSRSGQTKDYKIGICCFSPKHAALRRKSKDWLAWNQNNVSEWSDMSTCGLLFQWASTIKIQLSGSRTKQTSLSSHWKLICSRHDIAELVLNNNFWWFSHLPLKSYGTWSNDK